MVLNVADRDQAMSWIGKAIELNSRAEVEMKETAQLVMDIQNESQGSLVDEIVHVANGVINQVETVAKAVNEITDVLSDVTGKIADAVGNVTSFIGKIGKIFG